MNPVREHNPFVQRLLDQVQEARRTGRQCVTVSLGDTPTATAVQARTQLERQGHQVRLTPLQMEVTFSPQERVQERGPTPERRL